MLHCEKHINRAYCDIHVTAKECKKEGFPAEPTVYRASTRRDIRNIVA